MQQMPEHRIPGTFTNNLHDLTTEQLKELTDYLEQRLSSMGTDGDCAYERALTRVYHQLLDRLREHLDAPKASA